MLRIFEATILLALILVFINIIFKEIKESKEIKRLFNGIVVSIYIITVVIALVFSFANTTTEGTRQANETVIEL